MRVSSGSPAKDLADAIEQLRFGDRADEEALEFNPIQFTHYLTAFKNGDHQDSRNVGKTLSSFDAP